ncbi:MAG: succinylglutamate desuccinylase/aspartoacylase family protein [Candidatus Nanosalina sp.]
MKVRNLGGEDPDHAVMYCVHGNEPCGKYAVEQLIHEDPEILKPVKLVMANPRAVEKDERSIDEDLNRVWNSGRNDTHESSLAEKIEQEISGTTVLDLHSSYSHPEPFGLITGSPAESVKQFSKLDVEHVADMREVYDHRIPGVNRIAVECGPTGSQHAIENAYRILKNFLKANGIITGESETRQLNTYRIYDKVEGENYQFTGRNFQEISEGETYAFREERSLEAKESFYPVLMSTTGYSDIVGFKAEKVDGSELGSS